MQIAMQIVMPIVMQTTLQAVTDFADQSVLLPGAALVALLLAMLRWTRGLALWLGTIIASFGLVLLLKLVFGACGSPLPHDALRSPSGHTMAATVIYGGSLILFAPALAIRSLSAGVAALAVCLMVGATRVALHDHTVPEAVLGGAIGLLAVWILHRLRGTPPGRLGVRPARLRILLAMAVLAPPILLHGERSRAEGLIQHLARAYVSALLACGPAHTGLSPGQFH